MSFRTIRRVDFFMDKINKSILLVACIILVPIVILHITLFYNVLGRVVDEKTIDDLSAEEQSELSKEFGMSENTEIISFGFPRHNPDEEVTYQILIGKCNTLQEICQYLKQCDTGNNIPFDINTISSFYNNEKTKFTKETKIFMGGDHLYQGYLENAYNNIIGYAIVEKSNKFHLIFLKSDLDNKQAKDILTEHYYDK